jgi:hypothetical protein
VPVPSAVASEGRPVTPLVDRRHRVAEHRPAVRSGSSADHAVEVDELGSERQHHGGLGPVRVQIVAVGDGLGRDRGVERPPVDRADLQVGTEHPQVIGGDGQGCGVAEVGSRTAVGSDPRCRPPVLAGHAAGARRERQVAREVGAVSQLQPTGMAGAWGAASPPTASHSAGDDRVGAGGQVRAVPLDR